MATATQVPNATTIQNDILNDAPGGVDNFLDSLFQPAPTVITSPPIVQAQQTQEPQAQTTIPSPQAPSFSLKAGSTEYKSIEEAQRGIEHKDALIEQMRRQLQVVNGVDPITSKPVQNQPISYMQNPKQYLEDLVNGAETDPAKYVSTQQQFIGEILSPLMPIVNRTIQREAEEQLSAQFSDFRTVQASPEFKKFVTDRPALSNAIEAAKNNPQLSGILPELLGTAYLATKGLSGNTVPVQQVIQQPDAQNVRPTLTQSTLTPPDPTQAQARPLNIADKAQRQEWIKQVEANGRLNNVRF